MKMNINTDLRNRLGAQIQRANESDQIQLAQSITALLKNLTSQLEKLTNDEIKHLFKNMPEMQ